MKSRESFQARRCCPARFSPVSPFHSRDFSAQREQHEGLPLKITDIECFVLLVPDVDVEACSSAQDDIVVRIHTDEGITGIGETDTNPWAVKALIEAPGTHCMGRGLKEMLLGEDPLQPEAVGEKLSVGS